MWHKDRPLPYLGQLEPKFVLIFLKFVESNEAQKFPLTHLRLLSDECTSFQPLATLSVYKDIGQQSSSTMLNCKE